MAPSSYLPFKRRMGTASVLACFDVLAKFAPHRNGITNGADLGDFFTSWGECVGCPADIDRNGVVNAGDLGLLISAWGPCN